MLGNLVILAISIAACLAVGGFGIVFAGGRNLDGWYHDLHKPRFNPPGWVFAPVWTVLYVLMGIAASLVWQEGIEHGPVRTALAVFVAQLVLNALWAPLFFGRRRIRAALIDVVLLWLAILATIAAFSPLSIPAAICLVPYLAWVTFAAILNAAIWRLNGG
jgi:translocator protein